MNHATSSETGPSRGEHASGDKDRGRCMNVAQMMHTDTNVENITCWTATVPLEYTQESPVVTDVKASVNVTYVKSSMHNDAASKPKPGMT